MSLLCEWPECSPEPGVGEDGRRGELAEYGRLCWRHYSRVMQALSRVPDLVEQTREAMTGGSARGEAPVSGGGARRPAPFDTSAVDAVDELLAMLASVAEAVAPRLHQSPPSVPLWWAAGRVQGLRPGVTPSRAGEVARRYAEWFRDRLPEVAGMEDVLDMGPELVGRVRKMSRKWPADEAARPLYGVPCPKCDLADLWRTPPVAVGWSTTLDCRSCGYLAPEEEIERLITDHATRGVTPSRGEPRGVNHPGGDRGVTPPSHPAPSGGRGRTGGVA